MLHATARARLWPMLAAALLLVAGCAGLPGRCAPDCSAHPPQPRAKRIKLLFTTDIHGYVIGDAEAGRIGYAALSAYAARQRAAGFDVRLLDGGDLFSGNSLALCDHGKSVAALVGSMGYAVLTPGNHAFDFDVVEHSQRYYPETILPFVRENGPPGLPPPVVVAVNMRLDGAPPPNMQNAPAVLYDGREDGNRLRLIVAGVTTPYIAEGSASPLDGYDFGLAIDGGGRPDDAATKRRVLDMLAEAVRPYDRPDDIVVVLSHIGWLDGAPYAEGRLSGKDLAGVVNVDIVLDGHTHAAIPFEPIGGALYANGGAYLESVLEVDVTASPEATALDCRLLRRGDFDEVGDDPVMAGRIRAAVDRHGFDTVLFRLPESCGDAFSGDGVLERETPLGRLLCRAQARAAGARAAFMNSGGIRAGLSAGQAVTVADIYDALPFPNRLLSYEMTGEELLATLGDMPPPGSKGFLQYYEIGATEEAGRGGGETRFAVAVNSFLAAGGDGFVARGRLLADHGPTIGLVVEALKQAGDMDWEEFGASGCVSGDGPDDAAPAPEASPPEREQVADDEKKAA